ncbi:hypothetical protein AAHC03_01662 [Spirometra sp. Aus1]
MIILQHVFLLISNEPQCPSNDDEALRYRSGLEGENRCMNQTDCLNVEADCVTCLNSVQRVAGWMNSTYLRWVTKIFIHSLCRVSRSSVCEASMWAIVDKATDNMINGPYAVQICRFIGTCPAASPLAVQRGFVCNLCESLLGLLVRQLTEQIRIEDVKAFAIRVCSVLPKNEPEAITVCQRSIVDAYLKIATLLDQGEATRILCKLLGTCTAGLQVVSPEFDLWTTASLKSTV